MSGMISHLQYSPVGSCGNIESYQFDFFASFTQEVSDGWCFLKTGIVKDYNVITDFNLFVQDLRRSTNVRLITSRNFLDIRSRAYR